MEIGGDQLKKELLRLKELGHIDRTIGAENVGRVIDIYNQSIEKRNQKRFNKDIRDRNLYYWKLWKRACEEVKSGRKIVKKLSPRKIFI